MAISREQLHRMIDQIPASKLPSISELLARIYEDEYLSVEEASEIDDAKKWITNGEYATHRRCLWGFECIS